MERRVALVVGQVVVDERDLLQHLQHLDHPVAAQVARRSLKKQIKKRGMFSDKLVVSISNYYSLLISFFEIFQCPYSRMQNKQNQNNLCCIIVKEVVYNVLEFDTYVTRVFPCNSFNNRTNSVEMIGGAKARFFNSPFI